MRTILLLGIAAGSVLLTGRAMSAEAPAKPSQTTTVVTTTTHADPAPTLGYGVPTVPDVRVYTGYADRVPSEGDYRRIDGYQAQGRWTGTWTGTYETPEGNRYEGSYEGSVAGRTGVDYPPPPYYRDGHDPRFDGEMQRRCGQGGAATGAIVGGVMGGVVGNRVAGHGDRALGTVIGGAVGAAAGAAVGSDADRARCDEWAARRGGHHPGHSGGYAHGDGYGYYYTPGVVVVTTISNGAPIVTETVETTTHTYYENAPVRKRHAARKPAKPKPRPRCAC